MLLSVRVSPNCSWMVNVRRVYLVRLPSTADNYSRSACRTKQTDGLFNSLDMRSWGIRRRRRDRSPRDELLMDGRKQHINREVKQDGAWAC